MAGHLVVAVREYSGNKLKTEPSGVSCCSKECGAGAVVSLAGILKSVLDFSTSCTPIVLLGALHRLICYGFIAHGGRAMTSANLLVVLFVGTVVGALIGLGLAGFFPHLLYQTIAVGVLATIIAAVVPKT
jgi:hypothetical protein